MAFIKAWMGDAQYRDLFHYHYRDTMHAAAYLNDRAAMHGEKVPFSKIKLVYLASQLNVECDRAHNSLEDARITGEVYRKLCMQGLLV
jgi:DNA polymerase III epsilon subunit-like protein